MQILRTSKTPHNRAPVVNRRPERLNSTNRPRIAVRYAVRAIERIAVAKSAKITYIVEQFASCMWYRCRVPGIALSHRGYDVLVNDAPTDERLAETDVLVLQRPTRPASLAVIRYAKSVGKQVVIDMDDDLWHLHYTNPVHQAWQDQQVLGVLEDCLRAADLVTVTTAELAQMVSKFNKNTAILPNMLLAEDWPSEMPERPEGDRVVLGWAGGQAHGVDLQLLSGVLENLLDRYPNLEVRLAGMQKPPFTESDRLKIVPPVPIEEYPALIAEFDIGMAPVADGSFNRCKSDLKFLEYAMNGTPAVTSRVVTYSRSVQPGVNGFTAANAKDWLKLLSRLIESRELRLSVGAEARRWAETRLMDDNVDLWIRAYGLE